MISERVEFQTSDNLKIAADYYPADGSSKAVVLVHMMPATKESWKKFAAKLQKAGFQALAIDLRGHGDSGGGDYRKFSDQEHQASTQDLEAAVKFLSEKGVSDQFFAGASIGANLSLWYLAHHPAVKAVILLSPGLDYHGIEAARLSAKISDKNKILFVGAEDDAATMGGDCQTILQALGEVQNLCLKEGGHGTNLFQSHPELIDVMIKFLMTNS